MEQMKEYEKYTNLAPIIRAATYGLIPIGETRQNFERAEVLKKDAEDRDIREKVSLIGKQYLINHVIAQLVHGVNAGLNKIIEEYAAKYYSRTEDLTGFIETRDAFLLKISGIITSTARKDNLFDFSISNITVAFVDYVNSEWDDATMPFTKDEAIDILTKRLKGKAGPLLTSVIARWTSACTGTKKNSFAHRLLENIDTYLSNAQMYISITSQELDGFFLPEIPTSYENLGRFLLQKEIDTYNMQICGVYDASGNKIAIGFNEQLAIAKNRFENVKGKLLNVLKKQIFVERKPMFTVESAESMGDVVKLANESLNIMKKYSFHAGEFCNLLDAKEPDIYFRSSAIGSISFAVYKDDGILKSALYESIRNRLLQSQKKVAANEIKKVIASNDYCLEEIQNLADYIPDKKQKDIYAILSAEIREAICECQKKAAAAEKMIPFSDDPDRREDFFDALREFYEACSSLRRLLIKFVPIKESTLNSLDASERITSALEAADVINKAHHMTRTFATRRIGDIEPERITALGATVMLAHSWDINDNTIKNRTHALLEKDGKYYYLSLISKDKASYIPLMEEDCGDCYKVVYTRKAVSLYKALKQYIVPRSVQKELEDFTRQEFVIEKEKGSIMVDRSFLSDVVENKLKNRTGDSLTAAIETIFEILQKSEAFSKYDLSGIDPQKYKTFKDFVDAFGETCVLMDIRYIKECQVDQAVKSGAAFLFEIYTQDLYKDNCKESNAMYLRNFMENCLCGEKKYDIMINSSPTVRYRNPVIKNAKVTHEKGSMLVRKTITEDDGTITRVPDAVYANIYLYVNKKLKQLSEEEKTWLDRLNKSNGIQPAIRPANSDITKDKRYTKEGFSIVISFTVYPHGKQANIAGTYINNMVRERLKKEQVKILSISRGYHSLIDYCLMQEDGTVLQQGDLSVLKGIDYYKRLSDIEELKSSEAKKWRHAHTIKNIRESYICDVSAVVANMAVENNAIIAIENILPNVKDKMACIDNQIFKMFEKKLVNKLSSYARKDIPNGELGSFAQPLQLAVPEENQMSPIQNGIVFYTNAAFTRNIDEETGFINLIDTSKLASVSGKRELLDSAEVRYEKERNIFEISFTYNDIGNRLMEKKTSAKNAMEGTSREWTVLMIGSRKLCDYRRNIYVRYNATERIQKAFSDAEEALDADTIIDTKNLPSSIIDELVRAFLLYCRGTVYDGKTAYYQSPITGKISEVSPDLMAAKQLGLKTVYTLNGLREGKKQNIVISKYEWVNSVIQKE